MIKPCKRCGTDFEDNGVPQRKKCDACISKKNDTRDHKREEEATTNELSFVGVDGEGQTGACMFKDCDCQLYTAVNPADDFSVCTCGHRKLPKRIPGEEFRWRNGHYHWYVMLRCGEDVLYPTSFETRLRIDAILEFLYGCMKKAPSNTAFVIYSGGYDLTMWWATMPENRTARMLLPEQRHARHSMPVEYPFENPKWEMDTVNGVFRFRPYTPKPKEQPEPPEGKTFTLECSECKSEFSSKRKNRKTCDLCKKSGAPYFHLCDVFPFWQSSFLKAINPAKYPPGDAPCTPEVYKMIEAGKAKRDVAVLDPEMVEYNRLECVTLANLCAGLNRALMRMGVRLRKTEWYGPGAIAAHMLKNWGAPKADVLLDRVNLVSIHGECDIPRSAWDAWHASYTAGWFEIFVHGIVSTSFADMFTLPDGIVYEYDINSAYPYEIARLPCLLHGDWEYGNNYMSSNYTSMPVFGKGDLVLIYATAHGSNPYAGAMLHRLNHGAHSVIRPHHTEAWYVREELEEAQAAGLIDTIEYKEWHVYHPCGCKPPCREIEGIYEHRRKLASITLPDGREMLGKDTPAGKAMRLGPNSSYGKFAQQIGGHPFLNWIYASLITSRVRTKILHAIATHPIGMRAVAKIATDGIYFLSPHPTLPLSDKLGDWEPGKDGNPVTHTGPLFFMSGVDWDLETMQGSGEIKSRGISKREALNAIGPAWHDFMIWQPGMSRPSGKPGQWWPSIRVRKPFEFYSCVQIMRWGAFPAISIKDNCQKCGERLDYQPASYQGLKCPKCGKWNRAEGYPSARTLWKLAGVVFEAEETISSDPHPKRRACSHCQIPADYNYQTCNQEAMYREDGVWRSRPFEAEARQTNGQPRPSYPYTKMRSMRETLSDMPQGFGYTHDGDSQSVMLEAVESDW